MIMGVLRILLNSTLKVYGKILGRPKNIGTTKKLFSVVLWPTSMYEVRQQTSQTKKEKKQR